MYSENDLFVLEKNAQNYVKNIEKSVEKLTTEDPFLKKMCRKISEKEGYDILTRELKDNISSYRKFRDDLKGMNIDTKYYDSLVFDMTSKAKIPYVPIK